MSKLSFRFKVLSKTVAPDTSKVVAKRVALATSSVLSKSTAPETLNVPNVVVLPLAAFTVKVP